MLNQQKFMARQNVRNKNNNIPRNWFDYKLENIVRVLLLRTDAVTVLPQRPYHVVEQTHLSL